MFPQSIISTRSQTILINTYIITKMNQVFTFNEALEASKIYFDGDELHRKLMVAVLKLPEKQRVVFNMKYFDEMKYEQISEILGTSVGALKASYHHAVKKIEDFLHTH